MVGTYFHFCEIYGKRGYTCVQDGEINYNVVPYLGYNIKYTISFFQKQQSIKKIKTDHFV